MKRIGGYEYPLLSAEQVAPPESMISGVDTIASGGVYTLDEHSRNVGWCRGMSEYTETFDSLDPAWKSYRLASMGVASGKLVTTPDYGTQGDFGLAYIDIPELSGDFEISVDLTWDDIGSNPMGRLFLLLRDASGNFIVQVGMNDGWWASLGEYLVTINGTYYYKTGYGTAPLNGSLALKVTRVSNTVKGYLDGTLRGTEANVTAKITQICLTQGRYTLASGYGYYTTYWDNLYLKRGW